MIVTYFSVLKLTRIFILGFTIVKFYVRWFSKLIIFINIVTFVNVSDTGFLVKRNNDN